MGPNDERLGFAGTPLLVVDDEPMMLRAIERLLGGSYQIESTVDPRVVVERVKGGARFAAILCDLMMPAMSGMALYGVVREIDAPQSDRIVFMTGGVFAPPVVEFLESLSNPRVEKPVDAESLRGAIRSVITAYGGSLLE